MGGGRQLQLSMTNSIKAGKKNSNQPKQGSAGHQGQGQRTSPITPGAEKWEEAPQDKKPAETEHKGRKRGSPYNNHKAEHGPRDTRAEGEAREPNQHWEPNGSWEEANGKPAGKEGPHWSTSYSISVNDPLN